MWLYTLMTKRTLAFPPRSLCTDPIVGGILSGWRFDISGLSPTMRTDYERHFAECGYCRRRQRMSRTIDVLLLAVSTLSIVAFLLAALIIRRLELLSYIGGRIHLELHHTAIAISLEAVAVSGLAVSTLLWVMVAIATPLPGFLGSLVQKRIPPERLEAIRDRFHRRAA